LLGEHNAERTDYLNVYTVGHADGLHQTVFVIRSEGIRE